MSKSVFRSAITGLDGEVDAGYLAMFCVTAIVTGAIPLMCLGAIVSMVYNPAHVFDVQGLGIGIGAVCTGLATALGGVGIFRMGDKEKNANQLPNHPQVGGSSSPDRSSDRPTDPVHPES